MSEQSYLKDLNPQQREAVTYGNGPLLVVAGAGSGKTRTLASRVAYLISTGVKPERILLLTFTRRAAEEMLKRAGSAIPEGTAVSRKVWGGTFHAIANRLLRIYAQPAGLSPDFTIMDRSDAEDLLNLIRNELGFSRKGSRFPRKSTCLDIYSRRVNGNEGLEMVLKKYFPWCLSWKDELTALFRAYVDRKQAQHVLDYDDLLLYWYYLLRDEQIAASIERRFDHILVDEYQDTNRIQAGILKGMRRTNTNIMAVGDDAQSIYSFRSATVRNMLDFPLDFPGAHIVTLEQNYRSRETILETTNRVIAQARERYSKDLWSTREGGQLPQLVTCADESQQDEMVIRQALDHYEQGIPLRQQAVLFRASHHSASLELELTRRNIPYRKYGGLRFLESAHIKDLIAFLRILENPQDEMAWFRVLQLLQGVGPVTAANAFKHILDNGGVPSAIVSFNAPAAARQEITQFSELLDDLTELTDSSVGVQIERIYAFYKPILRRVHENHEMRANDIEHLMHLASGYVSRQKFLSELVLDPPTSTGDSAGPPVKDEDWLVLSTIHSAKGLEWDAVYLIHAADGNLPSDMSTGSDAEIEEERRLTYVAMTRAKDFLYVLWPLRYYHRSAAGMTDAHVYAQRSRFLSQDVVDSMEQLGEGKRVIEDDIPVDTRMGQDISQKMRDMWE